MEVIINKNRRIFNKQETILFVIYSYIRLSLLNENILNYEIEKNSCNFSNMFDEVFKNYKIRKSQIKNIVKEAIINNFCIFSISIRELEALVEMIDYFYYREFLSNIHGVFNTNKPIKIKSIVYDLLDSIICFGKYPTKANYPFWIEYNSIFDKNATINR